MLTCPYLPEVFNIAPNFSPGKPQPHLRQEVLRREVVRPCCPVSFSPCDPHGVPPASAFWVFQRMARSPLAGLPLLASSAGLLPWAAPWQACLLEGEGPPPPPSEDLSSSKPSRNDFHSVAFPVDLTDTRRHHPEKLATVHVTVFLKVGAIRFGIPRGATFCLQCIW
jgi:hypothetical protein